MKNSYLFLVAALVAASCTGPDESVSHSYSPGQYSRLSDTTSVNANNPYDSFGELHDQVLDDFMAALVKPTDTAGILAGVESAANANSLFLAVKDSTYQALTESQAKAILDNAAQSLADVIANASVGAKAKEALQTFSAGFLGLTSTPEDYGDVYDYIVAFEADVNHDSALSANDKRVILTTTAIVRHSQFKRKRPKKNTDLDWEHNVFHLIGSIGGSSSSGASAVSRAVQLGILENTN
ncbi:MAG: hypothetical protein EOO51_00295 [Flavobacterium sp.]|nr:MAG: hypothetical protein EOO51_00295 [Flavobacterium sp.]